MTGSAPPPPGFKDHFSRDSSAYARFRPRYPAALFRWLATIPAQHGTAWDCATGSGQAATMLAPHFGRVVASDGSVAQLRAAERMPGVHYLAATGETGALAPATVDLVTVAQAFHWLEHARFYAEVDRVLAPGGAVAIWCYSVLHSTPEIDALLKEFYDGTLGSYWTPERKHVDRGYRDYRLPVAERTAPALAIEGMLTLAQFLGYLRTWSAVGRYLATHGRDPVDDFARALAPLWGNPPVARRIIWPLHVRAGRWLGAGAA